MFILFAILHLVRSLQIDSPIYNYYWCEIRNTDKESKDWLDILFVLSEDGKVLKSVDYGQQWIDESQTFTKLGYGDDFYELYMSPANKEVIYIFGRNGTGIKSEDCGAHYTSFTFPKTLYDFKFNWMDDEWIIAFSECTNCTSPFNKNLYASTNGGQDWNLVLEKVQHAIWDKLIDSDEIPDERIIASYQLDAHPIISYSDDYFKNYNIIHPDGIDFYQSDFNLFITTKDQNFHKLYVSPAFYNLAELQPILVPIQEQYSFTLLETSSDQIFLSVSHNETIQKYTTLYTSDYFGLKFTFSLNYNVRNLDTGINEFVKIESLKGVFIANAYDPKMIENSNIDKFKKTYISYNKGGRWHPLTCKGQPLQLQVSRIFSDKKAPGLILASGNVGEHLNEKETNLYLSRDGGYEWVEIQKGSFFYGFANRGGLIVLAQAHSLTDHLLYTWDQGLTWERLELEEKLMISNFVVKRLYQNIVAVGVNENIKGVLISLNITQERVCSGIWDPMSPDSDYEVWYPTSQKDVKCRFGQKFKFTRRKRDAKCLNQQDHDKTMYIEECECTENDWECDFGYMRQEDKCVPIYDIEEKTSEPCENNYSIKSGYRKIIGDYCEGGIDLSAKIVPCPTEKTEVRSKDEQKHNFKIAQEEQIKKQQSYSQQQQQQQQQQLIQSDMINQSYQNVVRIILIISILTFALYLLWKRKKSYQSSVQQQGKKQTKLDEELCLFGEQEEV